MSAFSDTWFCLFLAHLFDGAGGDVFRRVLVIVLPGRRVANRESLARGWRERGSGARVRVADRVSSGARGGAVNVSYDGRGVCDGVPIDGRLGCR